eukprot:TRINITY_DN50706_c0_g1_i1.p2 TRINITY_DN50706_c0_g1~~TRINITY_DN50706_c0_g1_i1.p2  ORF type:complete len:134 (+),score=41.55 TRINITY_DN50706_c0_g1_i1:81-482(+)
MAADAAGQPTFAERRATLTIQDIKTAAELLFQADEVMAVPPADIAEASRTMTDEEATALMQILQQDLNAVGRMVAGLSEAELRATLPDVPPRQMHIATQGLQLDKQNRTASAVINQYITSEQRDLIRALTPQG